MNNWFDREEQALVDAVNNGEISQEEFRREMAELRAALRDEAEEAAQEAYDDVMGRW